MTTPPPDALEQVKRLEERAREAFILEPWASEPEDAHQITAAQIAFHGEMDKSLSWLLPLARAQLEGWRPTHRHKKRGSEYVLLGVGKMQAERWTEYDAEASWRSTTVYKSVDMREVAIYRSVTDGSLWARPLEEFEDGRFEPLPSPPQKDECDVQAR